MRFGDRAFGGERPKIHARNLRDGDADLAIDCELDGTDIRPIKTNAFKQKFNIEPKTVYFFEGQWFAFSEKVSIVESPIGVVPRRLYWTGDGIPRQATLLDLQRGLSYRVGVPTPVAPTVSLATGTADEAGSVAITTFYVATFVNRYGDEGNKSPPSPSRLYRTGQTLTVGNIGDVASNINELDNYDTVVATRIYRLNEGQSRFVAEIPIGLNEYADDTGAVVLGEAFSTNDFVPPPEDLLGLHIMANGVALGFVGKTVHLSEPGQLNAWPYQFPVRNEIIGVSSFDNTAVVLTTGYPEIASVYDPRNASPSLMAQREPCVTIWSIVQAFGGVLYATPSGLFFIGSSGGQQLTDEFYDERAWAKLKPETMEAVHREGEIYLFHQGEAEGRCVVYDTREASAVVRQLTQYSPASHVKLGTDELYLTNGFCLERFQGGEDSLRYRWRGKEHGPGNPVAMTCGRAISDDFLDLPTAEEQEALNAIRDEVIESNRARIEARYDLPPIFGIGGAINQHAISGVMFFDIPLAGGGSVPNQLNGSPIGGIVGLPRFISALDLVATVYGDQEVVDVEDLRTEEPYRYSYSDRCRRWQYELNGNMTCSQYDMAGSESELHDGS